MSPYESDRLRGAQAFRDGLPFDTRESHGWQIGYGDAISIKEADPDER